MWTCLALRTWNQARLSCVVNYSGEFQLVVDDFNQGFRIEEFVKRAELLRHGLFRGFHNGANVRVFSWSAL